jgi:hypothetical protein
VASSEIPGAYVRAVAQWQRQAIEIVTERIAQEGRDTMPVLDPMRTQPPGEGWSYPPGALAASVSTGYGEDGEGPYGDVTANEVYRFSRKKKHRIRPALDDALGAQAGRSVP